MTAQAIGQECIRWFLPEGYLLGSTDSKFSVRVRGWTEL